MKIGILALQGSFSEHRDKIQSLGIEPILVKTASELSRVQGLIIPGGESTTMDKLLRSSGLREKILIRSSEGMAIYGTCAGAILLAKEIEDAQGVEGMGLINIKITRNAYGNQLASFVTKLKTNFCESLDAVFIRAPQIIDFDREKVKILGSLKQEPVLVQEKKILVSTFHPELTNNTAVHEYFISIIS